MDLTTKSINLNTIILSVVLLFTLMNGCNSCSNRQATEQTQSEVKVLKKQIISLDAANKTADSTLYKKISKDLEMVLIIENEIDGKQVKSTEIKRIVTEYNK